MVLRKNIPGSAYDTFAWTVRFEQTPAWVAVRDAHNLVAPQLGPPTQLPFSFVTRQSKDSKPLGNAAEAALNAAKDIFDEHMRTFNDARPIVDLVEEQCRAQYVAAAGAGYLLTPPNQPNVHPRDITGFRTVCE